VSACCKLSLGNGSFALIDKAMLAGRHLLSVFFLGLALGWRSTPSASWPGFGNTHPDVHSTEEW
jgi:hypothetical protein